MDSWHRADSHETHLKGPFKDHMNQTLDEKTYTCIRSAQPAKLRGQVCRILADTTLWQSNVDS